VPDPKPRLRLIPLDDTVVFPNMGITLTVDVGDDERVVLVPRHENEFLDVGTIAEVSEPEYDPDELPENRIYTRKGLLQGLRDAAADRAIAAARGFSERAKF